MATERIVIEFQSRGVRTVNRDLNKLKDNSRRTATVLQQLRNALVVVAAVRVIRRFTDLADSFVNLRNRLQATLGSFDAARQAQQALLQISLETRTGIDATGDAFARLALGARDLGLSTQTLLDVTRTLNQAIILSGATAQEARNAMIQLSQGIASGALRGDELRAVLEQLPLVARIIADEFDVPIGQLRKLGEEGLLVTDRLIAAFQNAAPRIAEDFENTVVTIDQALTNLITQFTAFISRFSEASGASNALVNAITSVGSAFEFLTNNVEFVNAALATLATAGILKLVSIVAGAITRLRAFQTIFIALAFSGGTLTGIITALRVAVVSLTAAIAANPIGLLAVGASLAIGAIVGLDSATTNLTEAIEEETSALDEVDKQLKQGLITSEEMAQAKIDETLARKRNIEALLDEALAAQTANDALGDFSFVGADNPATAEIERLRAALDQVRSQLQQLEATRRQLRFDETGADIQEAFSKEVQDTIADLEFELAQLGRTARQAAIAEALRDAKLEFDAIGAGADRIRELAGAIFDTEAALEAQEEAAKRAQKALEEQVESAKELFEESLPLAEREVLIDQQLANFKNVLVKLTNDEARANEILTQEKERLLEQIREEIAPEALDFLEDRKTVTEQIADAEKESQTIKRQLIALGKDEAEATSLANEFLQERIELLKEEEAAAGNALLQRFNLVAAARAEIAAAQEALGAARGVGAITPEQEAETLRRLRRELVGAGNDAETFAEKTQLINEALRDQIITQEEAIQLTRQARVEFLETQRSLEAGAERALLKFVEQSTDAAAQTEELLTSTFNGLEDAIVQFAETGKLSFEDLFATISAGLIRLAAQQFLGGIFGGASGAFGLGGPSSVGGVGGAVISGVSSLFGFQNGGSFQVNANNALASLPGLDNRLIAFRAQDGEEVTVTPRNQQGAFAGAINQVFNITTPDADSFVRSQSQIKNRELAGLNQARLRR